MVRDHNGQQLAYLYFEERAGAAISGEVAQQRRGAPTANIKPGVCSAQR
jgi:hypothetical protein